MQRIKEEALAAHKAWRGKIEIKSRAPVTSMEELALAYTPGVAEPCKEIAENPDTAYEYTRKWNTVAVVTDGSAVLGLGNIGALAGLPVMEGKALLFKAFADIDAIPILVDTQDADEIVRTVRNIASSFGGINLEDIAAPRCFEVERKLKELLPIPVFHDDQHGTAVVVGAALLNALRLRGGTMEELRVVVNGAGAAGTACARLMLNLGVRDLILVDREGIIDANQDPRFREMADITNPRGVRGGLIEALQGADVFLGVSAPGVLSPGMIHGMAQKPVIFAMANPVPEIMPEEAIAAGAFIVGTGRSDFPNQINNVLAFPGIFRGALDARAPGITETMKIAAAKAIASLVPEEKLSQTYIIPEALNPMVAASVAQAVKTVALQEAAK